MTYSHAVFLPQCYDSYSATDEGRTKNISEFWLGIEPTAPETPIGYSKDLATTKGALLTQWFENPRGVAEVVGSIPY